MSHHLYQGNRYALHEWTTLRRRNLHDNLHQLFSEPWQRRLRQEMHRVQMEAIHRAKFGDADYDEARRIKAWLANHPQRIALLAFLNDL